VSVYLTFRLIFLRFVCYSYVLFVNLSCLSILRFVWYSYVLSVILTFCLLFLRFSVILTFCLLILRLVINLTVFHNDGSPPWISLFEKTICKNFGTRIQLFLRFVCYSYVLSVILTFCLLFLRFVCSFLRLYSTLTTYRLMVLLHVILLLLLLKLQFLLL
jgi:hypothetical protein